MPKAEDKGRDLIEQFLEALRALPGLRAEVERYPVQPFRAQWGHRYDAEVDLRIADHVVRLRIETKRALYPRDVRQLLWELRDFRRRWLGERKEREIVPLLVAESISPGAKGLLREERVGYYDSGGSLFLPARAAYLYVDKPPPKAVSKSMRSLFSRRRAQVLHVLLMRHEHWFGVKALAEQARVSPATVSQVLMGLERFDWLGSRGRGPNKERRLQEPRSLLDTWASQLTVTRPPPMQQYYVPSIPVDGLVEKVSQVLTLHGVEYAMTHEAAGQLYAPFLSSVSQAWCRLLTTPGATQAIGELGARAVTEGTNFTVVESQSLGELLFRKRVNGIWLASPIQVYLDLIQSEGRSKEMGEHLRRERIGF